MKKETAQNTVEEVVEKKEEVVRTPEEQAHRLAINVTSAYIQFVRSNMVKISQEKAKLKEEEKTEIEKFDLVLRNEELHLAHLLDIFHKSVKQAREYFPEKDNLKFIDEVDTIFDTFISHKIIKQCLCDYCKNRDSKTVVVSE